MVPKWLMALLVLLREAWSARRDAHIRFLKLQVEMLQSRLPGNRIIPDPVERRRLMKIGAEVGHAIEHTLCVVSIKTYRRWLREERGGRQPRKVGRPRLTKSLRELILRLARYRPHVATDERRTCSWCSSQRRCNSPALTALNENMLRWPAASRALVRTATTLASSGSSPIR